jgi:hypothetical protein
VGGLWLRYSEEIERLLGIGAGLGENGTGANASNLPCGQHAVQAPWRQGHGTANARGPGAGAQSALEARVGKGGAP